MQAHEQTSFLQAVGLFVRQEINTAVKGATDPLLARIKQLENILDNMPVPLNGKDGVDGKDGKDGQDGKSVDMDVVVDVIQDSVETFVKTELDGWERPINGKDGRDGIDGKDGAPGKDAEIPWDYLNEQLSAGTEMLRTQINLKMDSIPKPKDGKDGIDGYIGKDGRDGRDGIDGADGKDGAPGRDGLSVDADSVDEFIRDCVESAVARIPVPLVPISVVGGFIDRTGNLCLSLSNGNVKTLGIVVGRDGKDADPDLVRKTLKDLFDAFPKPKDGKDGVDGINGKDGFGFDDLSVEEINGELYLQFTRGDECKTFLLPHIRYMGIWKAGKYRIGNQTTYDGSQWIALADTETQPGTKDSDWQLCAKRGRDGKDGKQGKEGPQGKPGVNGRDGRDLTQLAFDGTKS